MHVEGETVAFVLLCIAHLERTTIGGRVCPLERDKKWAFLENLCHQTLSLSNINTQEIDFALKIWGYNCFYWFIVWAKELFDVFKGPP